MKRFPCVLVLYLSTLALLASCGGGGGGGGGGSPPTTYDLNGTYDYTQTPGALTGSGVSSCTSDSAKTGTAKVTWQSGTSTCTLVVDNNPAVTANVSGNSLNYSVTQNGVNGCDTYTQSWSLGFTSADAGTGTHTWNCQWLTTSGTTKDCTQSETIAFTRAGGGSNHTLTVSVGGTGTGTVGGGTISCPGTCSESVAQGTVVNLTASPTGGSTFGGFSGCDSTSGNTCTVTMSADRTVTATFTGGASNHTLMVNVGGTGTGTVSGGTISCPGTCSESVAPGTVVNLTASPTGGSTFGGFSGCDSTSGSTCTVTMSADRTVTATFTGGVSNHTLTVNVGGTGTGTVSGGTISCPGTCSESVAQGTVVNLTASLTGGSTFGGFSGCDSTSGNTCTVTVNADRTVTATFSAMVPAQIDFWSNDGTDGTLSVYIDGILQGHLTGYFLYPNQPSWGASGTLLVTGIPPGSHTLSATSSGVNSWPGTVVTLTAGQQLKWQFTVTQWCFWTNRSNVGAYISIYIDGGYVGQLTQYFSSTPAWGQSGTLTVSTLPGSHTLYAISQSGTYWSTTVSLTSGQQQLYEFY